MSTINRNRLKKIRDSVLESVDRRVQELQETLEAEITPVILTEMKRLKKYGVEELLGGNGDFLIRVNGKLYDVQDRSLPQDVQRGQTYNERMETTPEIVATARQIALTYMRGTRKGNPRPAWAHPEDVVGLVRSLPGLRPDMGTQCFLEAVAWLHDVLEDTEATEADLKAAGIPDHVVMGVKALTKEDWMTREWYFRGLDGAPELVRIVKVCDRIANLTEGRSTLGASWWKKYTHETTHFIVPLTDDMGEPWKSWLINKLAEATA